MLLVVLKVFLISSASLPGSDWLALATIFSHIFRRTKSLYKEIKERNQRRFVVYLNAYLKDSMNVLLWRVITQTY